MIKRFSLYGFLKNQRYFEPFIILFFLQQGLSFTQIGFLIAFRELFINLMEIPSGAVADLFGRRRSMILAFVSYIISFAIFGFSQDYWYFFIAMFFFAIGEAFRTGTHKAMIFTWLRIEGRLDEKTKVYGYTRSWSKIGSAVSTVLAVAFVLMTNNYAYVFFFAIIPYIAGLINLMTYPKELEGQPSEKVNIRDVVVYLWECIPAVLVIRRLRRLIIESMSFEGVYKAVADYLQPIVKNMALLLPIFIAWGETRRSAVMIGAVYVILYLVSAYASRNSHRLTSYAGGEEGGSRLLWKVIFILYISLIPLLFFGYYYVAVIGFIALALLQNFWRPILISRFDAYASETKGATVLSIESQAKSVSTMIIAPILGAAVDFARGQSLGGEFWPVATIAAIVTLFILLTPLKEKSNGKEPPESKIMCIGDMED
ncbi:MAG: MFS transporter [Deltaproteobacteria bacterium]|nr:MFS transporter [Deltaproteobacteria bacterium]